MFKREIKKEQTFLIDNLVQKNVLRFFFSHHPPEHISRTLEIVLFNQRIQLCARCSGLILGVVLGLFFTFFFSEWLFKINLLIFTGFIILAIIPCILDFYFQLTKGTESNNVRRIVTGGLFGFGIHLCLWLLFFGFFLPFVLMTIFFVMFSIWFFSKEDRTRKMIEHLELYYKYYQHCRLMDLKTKLEEVRK